MSCGKRWLLGVLGLLTLYGAWMGSSVTRRSLASEERASSLYGWDTSFYYFWLRSVALDFDVDFENEIALADTLPEWEKEHALRGLDRTELGRVPNKYAVGWAVFHLPWFAAGHGAALLLDGMGAEVRTDGFGKVYERFLYLGSLLYAGLGGWFTYRLLRRYFNRETSLASLAVVWISGFLIYYQLGQYAMAHNLAYLCVVSVFYWALEIRDAPSRLRAWPALGLSVGLLLITRYQAAVYLLFPFALCVVELLRRRPPLLGAGLALGSIAGVVSLQLLAWKAAYGSWLVYSYRGEGFRWGEPAVWKSLFDPYHGLIYWHPVFLAGIMGMFIFVARQRQRLAWLWLVSFALMVWVNAAWETWWFGASFGGRAYEGATLFVVFGVATLLDEAEAWSRVARVGLWVGLLALALWNLGVLEVSLYSWESGISLDRPVRWWEFGRAIWERWFGGGAAEAYSSATSSRASSAA